MTRSALALPLLFLLACDASTPENATATSGGSTGGPADDADQTSSTSGTADTTGASSTGLPVTTGEDPNEGSTGEEESGGSSSSEGVPPPDYATPHFPLAVGLQWSYRLTRTDGTVGQSCLDDGAVHVMRVTEENAGVFTRTEEPSCYFDALQFRIDGAYVDVNNGAWYHQLLLPPEQDATWPAGGASGASYIWDEFHPSYTVEAGVFEDCWRRKQQGYDVWEIYCRDVGMVESFYDAWGSNSRSELIAFEG